MVVIVWEFLRCLCPVVVVGSTEPEAREAGTAPLGNGFAHDVLACVSSIMQCATDFASLSFSIVRVMTALLTG